MPGQNRIGDAGASLVARRVRLWGAAGAGIAIIPYRFTLNTTRRANRDSGQAVPMSAGFVLRQADSGGGSTSDSTWIQPLRPSAGTRGALEVEGFVVIPAAANQTSWQLTATTDPDGAHAEVLQSAQAPHPGSTILLSDFLLGSASNGLTWCRGGATIRIAVSDTFPRRDVMHVYYQLQSNAAYADVRTTLTVSNVTNPQSTTGRLQIFFDGRLAAGLSDADRELELSRLRPGRYLLELQVAEPHGGGATVWSTYFVVK